MSDIAGSDTFDYRARIYRHYVTARLNPLAPPGVNALRLRAPYLERLIRRHFPDDRKVSVMDLGCGYGALMYFARRAGYLRIDGVDHSIEQVAAAQRLGIEGARVGDLIEALRTTRDESQDVVIAFDVIHTFKKEELTRFVDEVWRILRPGGKWIIHTANAESPFAARTQNWEFVSELSFTRNSIGQLLLASGFTYVECFEDAPVPHGIKSAIRWALWKVIRLFLITCLAVETGRWDSNAVFSQVFLAVAKK